MPLKAWGLALVCVIVMTHPGVWAGTSDSQTPGKSPHGMDVDPTGRWISAGGKLQPATTVLNFEKIQQAIDKEKSRYRDQNLKVTEVKPEDIVRKLRRMKSPGW